jgi:hypothetical protein
MRERSQSTAPIDELRRVSERGCRRDAMHSNSLRNANKREVRDYEEQAQNHHANGCGGRGD